MSALTLHWAWLQRLPPVEKLVLLQLADRGDQWHHCDQEGLVAFAGIDVERLEQALRWLRGAGYIERRDEATLNLVRINFTEEETDLLPFMIWARRDKRQYVYFLRSRDLVKIGYSTEPAKRIKSIRTSWPHELELLKLVEGGKRLEAEYHDRFKHLRQIGEWFTASRELLDFIAALEAVPA